jgi:hypothetical protein
MALGNFMKNSGFLVLIRCKSFMHTFWVDARKAESAQTRASQLTWSVSALQQFLAGQAFFWDGFVVREFRQVSEPMRTCEAPPQFD